MRVVVGCQQRMGAWRGGDSGAGASVRGILHHYHFACAPHACAGFKVARVLFVPQRDYYIIARPFRNAGLALQLNVVLNEQVFGTVANPTLVTLQAPPTLYTSTASNVSSHACAGWGGRWRPSDA